MEENLHQDDKTSISLYRENRAQALGASEVQERGDVCMPAADVCWCTAETNTTL